MTRRIPKPAKPRIPKAIKPPMLEAITPMGWFAERGWTPFDFQHEAWAAYAEGRSGLIHASTGTGKTYAAFFGPVLEALTETRDENPPPLRVLWLTPLRALSADTARSLEAPLAALGLNWDVGLRTGDTTASVRTKQKLRLPTVLVTTPESLALQLSYDDAEAKFANLRCVVVDEWHELLSSKRGTLVELALARLRRFQPSLRTWGLSATLGNTPTAARTLLGTTGEPVLIRGKATKQTIIDSVLPPKVERFPWGGHMGLTLIAQVVATIEESRSALVFTNTRSQTEVWYQAILAAKPEWAGMMALHHGSLDREVRDWVEDQLRAGSLRCVVCTSSLDLGVDFAPVDRVIQVGSPKGVARLMQRAGRSGHQPGGVSRVTCVPTNALELVEVAAARTAALAGKIEAREPYCKPLDVLAQHIVTCAVAGGFFPDELFDEVRTTVAYAELTREEFDWALDFAVRGGETLRAYPDFRRVTVNDDGRHIVTDRGVTMRHRMGIGTITSEASTAVRFLKGGRLGHVEELFAARLKPGDRFTFAGRTLEFIRLKDMTAWVKLTKRAANTVPRWAGGRMPLSTELSEAVREQLDRAADGFYDSLELETVRPILELQAAWSRIPRPGELLIERVTTREGEHWFLFPFEGRLAHEGLAALIAHRISRLIPITLTMAINDYGFELLSPSPLGFTERDWRDLLRAADLAEDIGRGLNTTELAKRQFRETARVAGLVGVGRPGANKSAKQLQASSGLFFDVFREYDPGNLLLRQAEREVLERQFDEARLRAALERIAAGVILMQQPHKPTPLAFPLLVERLRGTLSSESLAERVKRMTADLERTADAKR